MSGFVLFICLVCAGVGAYASLHESYEAELSPLKGYAKAGLWFVAIFVAGVGVNMALPWLGF